MSEQSSDKIQDLCCYSIDELEEMMEGLLEAIYILQEDFKGLYGPTSVAIPKEYTSLLNAIEIEILERTLLK